MYDCLEFVLWVDISCIPKPYQLSHIHKYRADKMLSTILLSLKFSVRDINVLCSSSIWDLIFFFNCKTTRPIIILASFYLIHNFIHGRICVWKISFTKMQYLLNKKLIRIGVVKEIHCMNARVAEYTFTIKCHTWHECSKLTSDSRHGSRPSRIK